MVDVVFLALASPPRQSGTSVFHTLLSTDQGECESSTSEHHLQSYNMQNTKTCSSTFSLSLPLYVWSAPHGEGTHTQFQHCSSLYADVYPHLPMHHHRKNRIGPRTWHGVVSSVDSSHHDLVQVVPFISSLVSQLGSVAHCFAFLPP